MAGSTNLRQLYTKSSATTGSPLLHLASWRSLNTHTRLSLLTHDSATAGTILPCASVSTSPSNKSRTTLISGTPVIWCGSSDCGSVTLLRVSTLACAELPPAFSAAFSPPQPDSASTAASATADKGKVCFIYLSFFYCVNQPSRPSEKVSDGLESLLHRHGSFDVRMRIVAAQLEIFKCEVKQIGHIGV